MFQDRDAGFVVGSLLDSMDVEFLTFPSAKAELGLTDEECKSYYDDFWAILTGTFMRAGYNEFIEQGVAQDLQEACTWADQNLDEAAFDLFVARLVNGYNKVMLDASGIEDGINLPDVTVGSIDTAEGADPIQVQDDSLLRFVEDVVGSNTGFYIGVEQPENGTIALDRQSAKIGETVVVSPQAAQGYKVSKVYLNGQEIAPVDGVYSFTVGDSLSYQVSAEFVEEGAPEPGPAPDPAPDPDPTPQPDPQPGDDSGRGAGASPASGAKHAADALADTSDSATAPIAALSALLASGLAAAFAFLRRDGACKGRHAR